MLVRVIKDFIDKDTKETFSSCDTVLKKVSESRGTELISKGFALECTLSKSKKTEE